MLLYLNNYFRLHVCLSAFPYAHGSITLQFFITLLGPEALSMWCWVKQSRATYTQCRILDLPAKQVLPSDTYSSLLHHLSSRYFCVKRIVNQLS